MADELTPEQIAYINAAAGGEPVSQPGAYEPMAFDPNYWAGLSQEERAAAGAASNAQVGAPSQSIDAPTVASTAPGGGWGTGTPQPKQAVFGGRQAGDDYLTQNRDLINDAYGRNGSVISGLGGNAAEAEARSQQYIQDQDTSNNIFVGQSGDLANRLGDYGTTANQNQRDTFNAYATALGGLNQRNDAAVGGLQTLNSQLANPLKSQVSWQGDLSSQAARADQGALAAQNRALGQLQGVGDGSLDYRSQAAAAFANPEYTKQVERGIGDLYGVSRGSKDTYAGQADPKAYAAAQDAMAKFKGLSDPTVTDKERFLYEQSRLGQERDELANRNAIQTGLRQRGMGGSGMELTSAALGGQQASQNRLLSDLGANAGAIDRAQQNLQAYSNSAQQLNDQGNAIANANVNRQLAGLQSYTDASGALRGASFDEAYKRGMGADSASANNQATRFGGMQAAGNQANTMQADAFKRGTAADQTAQFNRSSSIDVAKYNSTYAANERDQQWNRGQGLANTQLAGSAQNAANWGSAYNASTETTRDTYGRQKDVLGAYDIANTRQNSLANQQTDRKLGRTDTNFNNQLTIGQLGLTNNNQQTTGLIDVNKGLAGSAFAAQEGARVRADAQSARDAEPGGLLGTGILGKNGILGLDGIPLL